MSWIVAGALYLAGLLMAIETIDVKIVNEDIPPPPPPWMYVAAVLVWPLTVVIVALDRVIYEGGETHGE